MTDSIVRARAAGPVRLGGVLGAGPGESGGDPAGPGPAGHCAAGLRRVVRGLQLHDERPVQEADGPPLLASPGWRFLQLQQRSRSITGRLIRSAARGRKTVVEAALTMNLGRRLYFL